MKIIGQTPDQISLKDGNATSLIVGGVLIIVGAYIFFQANPGLGISNGLVVGAGIFVFGVVMILLASTITVVIDKTQNTIAFLKKRLIGGKSQNYNVQDVMRIELRSLVQTVQGTRNQNGTMSMPHQVLKRQSVFVFKDGSELPLEHVKTVGGTNIGSSMLLTGTGKELSVAKQVADFLNVPLQEIGPGSTPIGSAPSAQI
jgi:hypothetical protein